MGLTHFPNGVSSFGMPVIGGGGMMTTGNVFFVDSGSSAAKDSADRGTKEAPFLTIDYAIGRCTANNGDVIFVMPGHAESVTAAAGIDLDVAGVTLIGLGEGASRPTITFDTATTADMDVDAAGITIMNMIFVGDIDALAAPIDVNAADFTMIGCEMRDSGTKNTVRWILADANADRMTIKNCVNRGTDTAGNTAWITLTGCDGTVIEGCRSNGDFSAANIQVLTTAVTDALITRNHLENANAVDVNIEGVAASTGWISYNSCRIATDAQTTWINTPGAMSLFENYGVNNDGETGKIIGTASV